MVPSSLQHLQICPGLLEDCAEFTHTVNYHTECESLRCYQAFNLNLFVIQIDGVSAIQSVACPVSGVGENFKYLVHESIMWFVHQVMHHNYILKKHVWSFIREGYQKFGLTCPQKIISFWPVKGVSLVD